MCENICDLCIAVTEHLTEQHKSQEYLFSSWFQDGCGSSEQGRHGTKQLSSLQEHVAGGSREQPELGTWQRPARLDPHLLAKVPHSKPFTSQKRCHQKKEKTTWREYCRVVLWLSVRKKNVVSNGRCYSVEKHNKVREWWEGGTVQKAVDYSITGSHWRVWEGSGRIW